MEIQDEPKAGAPEWMVTFADLMSLLLTFFVLLLSFSNMEIVKFRTMAGSVKNALGLRSEISLSDTPTGSQIMPNKSPKEGEGQARANDSMAERSAPHSLVVRLRALVEELEKEQAEEDKQNAKDATPEELDELAGKLAKGLSKLQVIQTDEGVSLQVDGDLFFASGRAELQPAALRILNGVAEIAKTTPQSIDVEGHTDNVPIKNRVYPSNWELSAARAGSAVRHLVKRGVPSSRVRAIGYSDTTPLKANATATGRAANRRVTILFRNPVSTTSSNVSRGTKP